MFKKTQSHPLEFHFRRASNVQYITFQWASAASAKSVFKKTNEKSLFRVSFPQSHSEQRAVHYLSMSIRRIRKIRVQKNTKSPFRVSFPPSEQRAVHYLSMSIRSIRVQKYQTATIRNVRNIYPQRTPRNITHPRASPVQKSSFNISRIVAKC